MRNRRHWRFTIVKIYYLAASLEIFLRMSGSSQHCNALNIRSHRPHGMQVSDMGMEIAYPGSELQEE